MGLGDAFLIDAIVMRRPVPLATRLLSASAASSAVTGDFVREA